MLIIAMQWLVRLPNTYDKQWLVRLPSLAIGCLVLTRPHLHNLFTISTSVAHLVTGVDYYIL